ncbi:uncharacterized protein LOC143776154 isoform X2 [Ranitomeya variabilis]|uniref:uncharacterized protein LOC143776154 isoform X2 n=1 Tax=Ranitomeya variabilis TaxID=490064 RepID=UPI004056C17A
MASKNQRPMCHADSNIRSAGGNPRADAPDLLQLITQKKRVMKEITIMEQIIQWKEEKIHEDMNTLRKLHLTLSEKMDLETESYVIKSRIVSTVLSKRVVEKRLEGKKKELGKIEEELDTIEEDLHIHDIEMTPLLYRPNGFGKCFWCPQLVTIQEETSEQIEKEDKMKENTIVITNKRTRKEKRPSRLQSFLSCFCLFTRK